MMKWLWRFASSEQAPPWKDVIHAKYEMDDHWITKMVTGIYGSRLWRAIRNHWSKLRGNCNIKLEIWSSQGWNLSFRRYLNDWEIHRLVEFYKVVGQFKGTTDAHDSLGWQDHIQDNFSVKRAYKKFNPCNSQRNGWPWKLI
ncbi:hypothetical protein MTR67_014666 [Solanum verrucosum]|uniref:Uncharacterized protein n=1 Tax=Solanum verrucosum TaxID=315347 RepID=A0AAF0QIJ3_SOLVR|nr:hypothetical protein MTR67_014666 [Solanum verrucosum]